MKALVVAGSLGIAMLSISTAMGQAGDPAKLVGVKKCGMCHRRDATGNQYGKWKQMKHSHAYEVLGSAEAKAVGAKLGIADPQKSGKCLKCHSTAYYFKETVQNTEVKVENGVTCESCHGPGADYKKMSIMKNHADAVAHGLVPDAKKRCTLCHNDKNPTWDPNRYTLPDGTKTGFDLKQAYEKIKHEIPGK